MKFLIEYSYIHPVSAEKYFGEEVVNGASPITDGNDHVISLFIKSVWIVILFEVFGFPRRLVAEYLLGGGDQHDCRFQENRILSSERGERRGERLYWEVEKCL